MSFERVKMGTSNSVRRLMAMNTSVRMTRVEYSIMGSVQV